MQDKNKKLAKENNQLKTLIAQKTQLQEEILKKSIKSEYAQILTYKQMVESIESGIEALEDALERCKTIKNVIFQNKRLLSDTTNLNRDSAVDLNKKTKDTVENENKLNLLEALMNEKTHVIKSKKTDDKNIEESLFDKWK